MRCIVFVLALGCSSGPTLEAPKWRQCPTENLPKQECATFAGQTDDGSPMPLRMVRIVQSETANGQLWLLQGGPGGSSVGDFAELTYRLSETLPQMNFYAIDHRGVGGDSELTCPQQTAASSDEGAAITDAEWKDCAAHLQATYGDTLAEYTTTKSAQDLHDAIEATADPAPIYLWGISYATFQLQRYMHLYPDHADAIILEGISPTDNTIARYSREYNEVGRALFDACKADAACVKRFPNGDPWKHFAETLDLIDAGHCSVLGAKRQFYRRFMAQILLAGPPYRDLMPAMAYRLRRCNGEDVAAWSTFYNRMNGQAETALGQAPSVILFHQIAASELWSNTGASVEALVAAEEGYLVTNELTARVAKRAAFWPKFTVPKSYEAMPTYSRPVLMLQGDLDPATRFDRAVPLRDHFNVPGQHWVTFANGPHSTGRTSDCGLSIIGSFLQNPMKTPDAACAQSAYPLRFDGSQTTNHFLLGRAKAWD